VADEPDSTLSPAGRSCSRARASRDVASGDEKQKDWLVDYKNALER
jgi:hypothetical protein